MHVHTEAQYVPLMYTCSRWANICEDIVKCIQSKTEFVCYYSSIIDYIALTYSI